MSDEKYEPTPEMLSKLIKDNLGLIYTFAIRMNYMHREEIVQQACLGIMRSKTYDPSVSVATFLHWQVRGAFTHLKKRESRFVKARARVPKTSVQEQSQESSAALDETVRRVPSLPEKQRRVMSMIIAGYNSSEIGREMGISHQGVNQLLSRAREALETRRMRGWGHGPRAKKEKENEPKS